MKRYMAILGFVFVGVLAGLLVRGIPIVVQVNAGGEAVATQNGDVNGDSMLDMSDAVYLLIHLFNGGPEPAAFAQMEPADLRGVEDSLESIADNFDKFIGFQCEKQLDRFVWQEDRTVIDTCKRLMWMDEPQEYDGGPSTFNEAIETIANFEHAGYTDWRMPTLSELISLVDTTGQTYGNNRVNLPPFNFHNYFRIWTSTRSLDHGSQVNFRTHLDSHSEFRVYRERLDQNWINSRESIYFAFLPVRDRGPDE